MPELTTAILCIVQWAFSQSSAIPMVSKGRACHKEVDLAVLDNIVPTANADTIDQCGMGSTNCVLCP
jgi:hypothetical protein